MASAKDIFEPHTFRAHTFASGTWRGIGSDVIAPDPDTLAFTVRINRSVAGIARIQRSPDDVVRINRTVQSTVER